MLKLASDRLGDDLDIEISIETKEYFIFLKPDITACDWDLDSFTIKLDIQNNFKCEKLKKNEIS